MNSDSIKRKSNGTFICSIKHSPPLEDRDAATLLAHQVLQILHRTGIVRLKSQVDPDGKLINVNTINNKIN